MITVKTTDKRLRTVATFPENVSYTMDGLEKDGGFGEHPTPVEMLVGAVGGCILTTMGGIAARNGYDLTGSIVNIDRTYTEPPKRRIATMDIEIIFPFEYEEKIFAKLKAAAFSCPVKNSLHQEIVLTYTFRFNDGKEIVEKG
jgi:uncharacterized OsmC-like protein